MKRELGFSIEEIKYKPNVNMPNGREAYVHKITGIAFIKGEDIEIMIDDHAQPAGWFKATDRWFKKFINKLVNL